MHIPAGVTRTGPKDFDPDMGRDRCRANSSGGPQGKIPCSRTTNTYNRPRSAIDRTPLPATMKWSRTRVSIKANAARSVCVSASSARLGSATPDGWLCAFCAPFSYVPEGRGAGVVQRPRASARAHNNDMTKAPVTGCIEARKYGGVVERVRQWQGALGPLAVLTQSCDAYQNGTSPSWMTLDAFGPASRSWRMNSWICGW